MKTILLYSLVFFSILNHNEILISNQKTFAFFIEKLLPSLFFLCTLVGMIPIINSQKAKWTRFLFHLDSASFFLVLKGILIGNPAFSYLCVQLYQNHLLSKKQAQRLIFCVNLPSISFMLMTLSSMYSLPLALSCFLIQLLSVLILLFITRSIPIELTHSPTSFSFHQSILFSIKTMALILAYLFVISSIKCLILLYFPSFHFVVELFFEFSSGAAFLMDHRYPLFYLLICFGFGGICSHLQIFEGCESLKMNYIHYFFFRILHVFLNLLIYLLFFVVIFHTFQ